MKKRPTLADVAKRANVSIMTVSRAMNNKPGLSEDLRQNILALAQEMGFRPSQIARGLATRQTSSIGLVVPDITNPFFAQIAHGVEEVGFEHGYNLFLINTSEDIEREKAALDSLWEKEIDGVILCSLRMPLDALEANVTRFPAAVLLNRTLKKPIPNVVTINVNDQRGAQTAVEHFIDQGRSNIAYIAGPDNSVSNQRRLEGFKQALKEAGLPPESAQIEQCRPDTEGGRAAMRALLARETPPDAVLAFNDLVAVGAVQVCMEAGKKVPDEVAVIGADDIPVATIIRPQLSTLRVSLSHIGRLSMRTLIEMIRGDTSAASYRIEPELVLRDSG